MNIKVILNKERKMDSVLIGIKQVSHTVENGGMMVNVVEEC